MVERLMAPKARHGARCILRAMQRGLMSTHAGEHQPMIYRPIVQVGPADASLRQGGVTVGGGLAAGARRCGGSWPTACGGGPQGGRVQVAHEVQPISARSWPRPCRGFGHPPHARAGVRGPSASPSRRSGCCTPRSSHSRR